MYQFIRFFLAILCLVIAIVTTNAPLAAAFLFISLHMYLDIASHMQPDHCDNEPTNAYGFQHPDE